MRRALLAVVAACTALAGLVGSASSPAGSVDGLAVDYAVSVASNPATVSPAGEVVEYRITVANEGLADVGATITDTTDGGTLVAVPAGCTGAGGTTFSCDVAVPAGESIEIDALVVTPTDDADGKITNTASVVVHSDLLNPVVDTDQTDNTASAETVIVAPDTTVGSSAFLQEGESLQFRGHVLTVLEVYGSSGGVQATMKDTAGASLIDCGGDPCDNEGLNVSFGDGERNDDGSWQRSGGLVEIDAFFGSQDPCRGLGNPDCFGLFYYGDDDTDGDANEIPNCVGGNPVEGSGPCITRVYKTGELIHTVVRQFTNDPDYLQPVKDLTNVTG